MKCARCEDVLGSAYYADVPGHGHLCLPCHRDAFATSRDVFRRDAREAIVERLTEDDPRDVIGGSQIDIVTSTESDCSAEITVEAFEPVARCNCSAWAAEPVGVRIRCRQCSEWRL